MRPLHCPRPAPTHTIVSSRGSIKCGCDYDGSEGRHRTCAVTAHAPGTDPAAQARVRPESYQLIALADHKTQGREFRTHPPALALPRSRTALE